MHPARSSTDGGPSLDDSSEDIIEIKYNHYILATWAVDCFNAALCLDIYIYLQH